jgi:hypothetical protein
LSGRLTFSRVIVDGARLFFRAADILSEARCLAQERAKPGRARFSRERAPRFRGNAYLGLRVETMTLDTQLQKGRVMATGPAKAPISFEEFWPHYLDAHSHPRTRLLHVGGTMVGLVCATVFLSTGKPMWAIAALVSGYGAAWIGHAVFERNVPATFSHPLWSLRGDLKMLRLALAGRLSDEAAVQRDVLAQKNRVSEGT